MLLLCNGSVLVQYEMRLLACCVYWASWLWLSPSLSGKRRRHGAHGRRLSDAGGAGMLEFDWSRL